jgi:hypothetical protein
VLRPIEVLMAANDNTLESGADSHPQIGMLATVRNRRAIVASVKPFDTPERRFHVVKLEYTDLEGAAQETVVWEIEHGRKLLPHISSALPSGPAVGDAWQECMELLAAEWRPLAAGLRGVGIPAPTDVDWDLPAGDLVGEARAVMVWLMGEEYVALVPVAGVVEDERLIQVTPQSLPAEVAATLFERIGGQA